MDPESVREALEKDLFTVNDATFNEAVRSALSEVGRGLAEKSNFQELFTQYLANASQFSDLEYVEPSEGGGRF